MKNRVPVAIGKKTPKDLSKRHYTSMNFGETYPVYVRPVFPNTTLKVRPDVFARAMPMQLPTLSNLSMDLNAFYVPYRYVWRWYDDFITLNKVAPSEFIVQFTHCPNVKTRLFNRWLNGNIGIMSLLNIDDQFPLYVVTRKSMCDFSLPESDYGDEEKNFLSSDFYQEVRTVTESGTPVLVNDIFAFKLTQFGKYVYHILYSLGYNLNFNYYYEDGLSQYGEPVSILPILCYFKIFQDYFLPNQLSDSAPFIEFFTYINTLDDANMDLSFFDNLSLLLKELFYYCYSYYKSNYFTSAWCSPNSPTFDSDNNNFEIISNQISQSITGSHSVKSYVINDEQTTRVALESDGSNADLTADNLNLLQKFARLIKRNLLSGKRPNERQQAEFGIQIDDFAFGRSHYYGSTTINLNKSDVVGTGDENLGDYAGRSWFALDKPKEFTFNCDYYGMVIIVAKLTPPSSFVDGIRHYLFDTTPFDFYHSDLDGSVMQAVSGSELLGRLPVSSNDVRNFLNRTNLDVNDTFGFLPRYSHLKMDIDDITGDFALPRYSANIDGFVLPRRILNPFDVLFKINDDDHDLPNVSDLENASYIDVTEHVTPLQVIQQTDAKQFNRIFKDIDGVADPFYCAFTFDSISYDGSIPLDDSHELQGKGKDLFFEKNGVNI